MPSIRIGFSTDFNLVGEQVGIGTTNPTARLEVAGQILADNTVSRGGISTLTRYDGFLHTAQDIGNTVSIAETTKGNLNSLSGEIKISGEVTVTGDTPIAGGRLESLTVTDSFDLPHGGSEYKDDAPEKGATRFNQDLGQLEFYTGLEWRTVGSIADTGGRGRGVFAGMEDPARNTIDYIQTSTLGNAIEFGDLTDDGTQRERGGGCSSSTRGYSIGGRTPVVKNIIDYTTLASAGNSIDYGDLTTAAWYNAGCSSSTRGLSGGGRAPGSSNTIEYFELGTTGSGLDFGDLTVARERLAALSSTTKGIWGGGYNAGSTGPALTTQDAVTISSKGDAVDFAQLDRETDAFTGCANSTRGLWAGGTSKIAGANWNIISYITLSSEGIAEYFGDLVGTGNNNCGSVASQTRGVFAGGGNPTVNTISYVQIATYGNSQDFGDLSVERRFVLGWSDSHGGLGGF